MARQSSFGIRAASIALLAIQAAPGDAAGEGSEVQPIASDTINISVSVAPRYQLRAAGGPRDNNTAVADFRKLCLASNAAPGLLPARLLRFGENSSAPAETAVAASEAATVTAIAPCIPRDGPLERTEVDPAASGRQQGVQVMLIQPE